MGARAAGEPATGRQLKKVRQELQLGRMRAKTERKKKEMTWRWCGLCAAANRPADLLFVRVIMLLFRQHHGIANTGLFRSRI